MAVYTYLRDRPERFARWFIYMRDVAVYSYMRNGCVYIRIHSMRDVAVDLYARWCVYIYIHVYARSHILQYRFIRTV